jgi:isocitrate dehydrogenase kinase/phosphatase
MTPLNIYLQTQLINKTSIALKNFENVIQEYGNASKDMVAANIFPGDMLWKNFGMTRHGRVVFYDYDEIEYITDCNFRRLPQARNEEEELSGEIWYSVGPRDVFPKTFAPFLLGHGAMREVFMRHHADLLDVQFWQSNKEKIMTGYVHDVYPYDVKKRLINQRLEQGVSHV